MNSNGRSPFAAVITGAGIEDLAPISGHAMLSGARGPVEG